jgi:hypothetical protein
MKKPWSVYPYSHMSEIGRKGGKKPKRKTDQWYSEHGRKRANIRWNRYRLTILAKINSLEAEEW